MLDMVGVTLCEWRVEEVCYYKTQGPNSNCKTEAPCSERPSLTVCATGRARLIRTRLIRSST